MFSTERINPKKRDGLMDFEFSDKECAKSFAIEMSP